MNEEVNMKNEERYGEHNIEDVVIKEVETERKETNKRRSEQNKIFVTSQFVLLIGRLMVD